MPSYEIINIIAQWFVLAIWFVGAVVMLGGVIYLVQSMAWVIYARFKGWNNILNAMRDYREKKSTYEDG